MCPDEKKKTKKKTDPYYKKKLKKKEFLQRPRIINVTITYYLFCLHLKW